MKNRPHSRAQVLSCWEKGESGLAERVEDTFLRSVPGVSFLCLS